MHVLRRTKILTGDACSARGYGAGDLPVSDALVGGRAVENAMVVYLLLESVEA